MWIHRFQKVLDKPREFGFDLQLDAGGQKGETLQQSLDIRIGAFGLTQSQTTRDLGECLCEFASHLAKMAKLRFLMFDQAILHRGRSN